jgi:methylaspartate ammonia-lyase
MIVRDVLLAPGQGAFFYDDQAAIRDGVATDGFSYVGTPVTAGFSAVRIPATSLGIGLVMQDGAVLWGDMMSVQYAGAAGRDPLFDGASIAERVNRDVVPRLRALDVCHFRSACDAVLRGDARMQPLAVEYGVSQALLAATAYVQRRTMAEVICAEYGLPIPTATVPIYAQSGDAREINVDKMILKRVDILPHGLINSREKFGARGETFQAYVRWVADRTRALAPADYHPVLHFDIYGWAGLELGLDADLIADFITATADMVRGHTLQIECPADFGSTGAQIAGYAAIVDALARRGSTAKIVADEYCNTLADIEAFAKARAAHLVQIKMPDVGSLADAIQAVLTCKANGVGAYVGGSCVETDLSARASVHVAVATQADMMLAKPGMGVDEGISIVSNEQSRLLTTIRHRHHAAETDA